MAKKQKYERIIESAVEIFAQKGFHETTMKEIAEAAGVGKGTIYVHFKNKDDLFSKILDRGIDELAQYVNGEINNINTPGKKLKKAIKAQLKYFNKHEDFCVFAFREVWAYREDLKNKIEKLHNKHTVILKEIINKGIKSGDFQMVNKENTAAAIVGMVWGAAVNSFLFSQSLDVDEIHSNIVKIIFEKHID